MSVDDQVQTIRDRIDRVERRFTHRIELVAVTKGFGPWAIDAALDAGCDAIGESYAQELLAKRDSVERLGADVHFIGRLQRNKVRQLVGLVDRWCSLDRSSLVEEVARRAPGAQVLVQVDATGDPAKGGCAPDEVPMLVGQAQRSGLAVLGLMVVGPTGAPPEAARSGFRLVRRLVDELDLAVCSMGMSEDLEIAVEEGSTEVRLGTALFGPRPPLH